MSDEPQTSLVTYRPPRSQTTDPGMLRMALIAGGIGAGLVLLIAGWNLATTHHAGIPVIEAETGPVRTKPDHPGGMQVDAGNEDMSSEETGARGKLEPPPETPDTTQLHAEMRQTPPPAPPLETAPLETATGPLVPDEPSLPAPSPAAGPAVVDHAAVDGATQVQLAALDSENAALMEWQRLQKALPDLLSNRHPLVTKVEHAGRLFYRLRTDGFGDIEQATVFCQQLRAKGAACSVAAF